ncbi:MAG: bifunctional diaminohydroxyphosphoribosylaminopyrimidine deaminase/5-amino-6-(5-phosphoribosylamino)uracil reductase RibD [Clostridiales bacterium]|nr:bifunctional diaminohydroxyphosphoribosylaminopyrimidine deaminase/5-amino-6-(5-phosphoribosylamino)uracil reductase RibD [Clostridiales bacterium]
MNDEFYMRKALELAALGDGLTSPNPLVGALLVREGEIVGQGWHQKVGTSHAEIHALREAGELAAGAALYVNLEPCCHAGRTPPCTEAIIAAGVSKVVCAMTDPNPLVGGGGLKRLQSAGIEVVCGTLGEEALLLNEVFITDMLHKRPFVALKTAATLDGKTAAANKSSKWISNAASREYAHKLRHRYDAVLTGIGTVLADDPRLTVRLPQARKNPLRVVIDFHLRTPPQAAILDVSQASTLLVTAADNSYAQELRARGVEILLLKPEAPGRFALKEVLSSLYEKGVKSVLLETGANLAGAFRREGLIDKFYFFLAPKLIGGEAPGVFGGPGVDDMSQALPLRITEVREIEGDYLFVAYPERR